MNKNRNAYGRYAHVKATGSAIQIVNHPAFEGFDHAESIWGRSECLKVVNDLERKDNNGC